MGCAGEGSRTRRGGRPRPPGREELFTTAHTQQIPRTLLPRERGCKQLGMTSPTILDNLIRRAYPYAASRLSICNVAPVSLLSGGISLLCRGGVVGSEVRSSE